MVTLKYAERVHACFEMDKLIPPPIRKKYYYHEDVWDTRYMTFKEDIIRKAIKYGITAAIQEQVKENYHDYHIIPPKEQINLLGTLEVMDERRRADREDHNIDAKKNKDEHPDEGDANSEFIPKVPRNKFNPNPGKVKQKNTSRHLGIQNYCILFNKSGYPEIRYKSHSSEQCNTFYSSNTKNDLDGRLSKRYNAVNNFHNTEKKMKKQMNYLDKQIFFQDGQEFQLPP